MENSNSFKPITNAALHQKVENFGINSLIANTDTLSLDDAAEEISKNTRFHIQFLGHIDELSNLIAEVPTLFKTFAEKPEQPETLEKLEVLSKQINTKTNLLEVLGNSQEFDASVYRKSGARSRLKSIYKLSNKTLDNQQIAAKLEEFVGMPHHPMAKVGLSMLAVDKLVEK